MKKYRKKPIVIEAIQWDGELSTYQKILKNFYTKYKIIYIQEFKELQIETLEGTHTASLNDWIIKGIEGEVYPCKPTVFEAIYEDA